MSLDKKYFIDISTLKIEPFEHEGFGGKKYIGIDSNGKKYLLKTEFEFQAVNEFAFSQFAKDVGILFPNCYLYRERKDKRMKGKACVAIEWIENVKKIDIENESHSAQIAVMRTIKNLSNDPDWSVIQGIVDKDNNFYMIDAGELFFYESSFVAFAHKKNISMQRVFYSNIKSNIDYNVRKAKLFLQSMSEKEKLAIMVAQERLKKSELSHFKNSLYAISEVLNVDVEIWIEDYITYLTEVFCSLDVNT